MKKNRTYKWNGHWFSLSELAKLCHLTPSAMHYRLKKYPAEIAMQPKTSQKGGATKKRYAFDGGIYTLDELAEKSGININTLRCRLFLGWSVERAMTEEVNHNLARK